MDAWNWITKEIRGNMGDGGWLRADSLWEIADVVARTFALMGSRRFPLYITPSRAREWFDIWKLIDERRMGRQGWPFSATLDDLSASQPNLKLFWSIAERNQDRARRRYIRARKMERSGI